MGPEKHVQIIDDNDNVIIIIVNFIWVSTIFSTDILIEDTVIKHK